MLSGMEIKSEQDMEKAGLVSAMSGSGQREILVPARSE